jgi:hypothetical protein
LLLATDLHGKHGSENTFFFLIRVFRVNPWLLFH